MVTPLCITAMFIGVAWCIWNGILTARLMGLADSSASSAPPPVPNRERSKFSAEFVSALAALLPETQERRARQELELKAAGSFDPAAWTQFQASRFLLAFVTLLTCLIGFFLAPAELHLSLILSSLTLPIVAWAVPGVQLSRLAEQRTARIERAMPEFLSILCSCLDGQTPPASILRKITPALSDWHPELAMELRAAEQRSEVGGVANGLQSLSGRFRSPILDSVAAILVQAQTTGCDPSKVLKVCENSIRRTLRVRAEARANAASIKLLFPAVLCLLPAVFLFLMGPAVIELESFASVSYSGDLGADSAIPESGTEMRIELSETLSPAETPGKTSGDMR